VVAWILAMVLVASVYTTAWQEVAAEFAEEAVARLGEEARSALGIPVTVRAADEGTLMPVQLLGKESPFVKAALPVHRAGEPRYLARLPGLSRACCRHG
jgi:hypothetical protein